MRFKYLAAAFSLLALASCGPAMNATAARSTLPVAAGDPTPVNEDLSQWRAEGMQAPAMTMAFAPGERGQLGAAAALTFLGAGTVTLSREIPTPGAADLHLVGHLEPPGAQVEVLPQIMRGGVLVGAGSAGPQFEVAGQAPTQGQYTYTLRVTARGPAKVTIRDVHITVSKQK